MGAFAVVVEVEKGGYLLLHPTIERVAGLGEAHAAFMKGLAAAHEAVAVARSNANDFFFFAGGRAGVRYFEVEVWRRRQRREETRKREKDYRGVALDHGVELGDDGLGQGVLLFRGGEHRPGKEGGC